MRIRSLELVLLQSVDPPDWWGLDEKTESHNNRFLLIQMSFKIENPGKEMFSVSIDLVQ
jgi:hypothetical protein